MRAEFPEFSTVRIRRLLPGDHHVSSSFSPPCVPHEGEVGAVVDVCELVAAEVVSAVELIPGVVEPPVDVFGSPPHATRSAPRRRGEDSDQDPTRTRRMVI